MSSRQPKTKRFRLTTSFKKAKYFDLFFSGFLTNFEDRAKEGMFREGSSASRRRFLESERFRAKRFVLVLGAPFFQVRASRSDYYTGIPKFNRYLHSHISPRYPGSICVYLFEGIGRYDIKTMAACSYM